MSVSIKDTKNAIYAAYQEALKQAKAFETQLRAKERELQTAASSSKSSPEVRTETKIVVKAPELNSIEGIVAALQSVQEGMNKAISELSAQQVAQAERLSEVGKNIESEKSQMLALYQVEMSDSKLQDLLENFLKEKEEFEKAFKELKESQEETFKTQNEAWTEEAGEQEVKTQERDKEAKKARQREQEEYNYNLQQTRNAQNDEYSQKRKQLQEDLDKLKAEATEKINLQEKEVAEKEKNFNDYKEKYEGLEDRLSKELKKAESEAKGIVEKDHRVRVNLYKKEVENQQKTLDLRISSLQEQIGKQDAQLKKLNEQLIAAHQQAQHLALKALEGSANNESLSAIREIAMEQAKNSNKNK